MGEPVQIRVDNRVRVLCAGDEHLAEQLQNAFTHRNPLHDEARRRNERRLPPENISTWRWEGTAAARELSLPRGGMERVREVLRAHGRPWEVKDCRSNGDEELVGIPPHLLTLRDYQEDIVQQAIKRESGIVRAGTGGGKTVAGFGFASRVQRPTLVVVWSTNLLDQWAERCGTELGLRGDEVGLVQGKVRRLRPITLAMQQTLAADPEWCRDNARTFGALIADELQRFAAPTLFQSIDWCAARYRLGISADETRPDRMEFLTYDLFGRVIADYPAAELVRLGAVLPVQIRVVPTEFKAPWFVRARRGGTSTWQLAKLMDQMSSDRARNELAAEVAVEEAQQGHQVLVWAARREQCHELDGMLARAGVLSGLLVGGADYAKRFKETRSGIVAGSLRAGVGTVQSVGQAQDLPGLARGVITVPLAGRNKQQIGQCKGRLCRLGTADAACYYLWDRHVYGAQHLKNLAAWFGDDVVVREAAGSYTPAAEYIRAMKAERDGEEPDALKGLFE